METPFLPLNTDTLLILEKSFESSEGSQRPVENLNLIEQLLVGIIEHINENQSLLKANFILRRLPVFTVPYFLKNEYAVILENLDVTLSSPNPSVSDTTSIDGKAVKVCLGHTEIFRNLPTEVSWSSSKNVDTSLESSSEIFGDDRAYLSHEIFDKFSSAFLKAFEAEIGREGKREGAGTNRIQLIGPHLLHSLKCHPDVSKIFTLSSSGLEISAKKKSRCNIQVNQETTILTIELEGTEAIIRPALFLQNGYPRINNALLERIPLYHPAILTIGESLLKGCLLLPTSFETLWTIQFWPSESHIIHAFHPNSIIGRIFKLYGSFCLNPVNFWEVLNSCFLIGVEDPETLRQVAGRQSFTIDFVISSFLHELEQMPEISDWEPKNFSLRLTSLLTKAMEAFDRGFHPHYFTKRNVLRKLWKRGRYEAETEDYNSRGFEKTDSFQPKRKDSMQSDDRSISTNDFHDDEWSRDEFGLHFEELSLDGRYDGHGFNVPSRCKSGIGPSVKSKEGLTGKQPSRSLSKSIGSTLKRRFSLFSDGDRNDSKLTGTNRSMTNIAAGFEEIVNQQRREQTFRQNLSLEDEGAPTEDIFSSSVAFAETSFSENRREPYATGVTNEGYQPQDSIYTTIFQLLNEITPSNYLSNTELITYLDNCRRVLGSQGELIEAWLQVLKESPKPKHICPHAFSPRQIQLLSLVIQTLSKCTTSSTHFPISSTSRLPAWEIIGDILRMALYQMRAEGKSGRDSYKPKKTRTTLSFKGLRPTKSFAEGSSSTTDSTSRVSKFSFRSGRYDVCKYHTEIGGLDPETETALALEDPETAATHRLLQWLWQLRNSEVGRLSYRAKKYIEALYNSSFVQSHFLEQFTESHLLESMALRSAVAVSRIMANERYPTHVPLMTASKRGWQWAEMVLSFASWNEEKGNVMNADIPLINSPGTISREIRMKIMSSRPGSVQLSLKRGHNPTEPDTEALSLAFHSELATPVGMHDFEEPLRPGPYIVPILIFSSMGYFSQWELTSGNIVLALVRLQKFAVLQHLAALLLPPHRKTALNEVRKLNKSLAYTAFQFEDNVMTKTFKRLASLRHTRRLFSSSCRQMAYSCDEVGCQNSVENEMKLCHHKGKAIECTKL